MTEHPYKSGYDTGHMHGYNKGSRGSAGILDAIPDPAVLRDIANRIFSPNMNSTDREFDLHRLRDMADRIESVKAKLGGKDEH